MYETGAKEKTCRYEGCTNQVQNGGLCKRHGAKVNTCSTRDAPIMYSRGTFFYTLQNYVSQEMNLYQLSCLMILYPNLHRKRTEGVITTSIGNMEMV